MIQTQGQKTVSDLGKPLLSFGLIADIQYCNCENINSRYYNKSLEKLSDCVIEMNNHNLDFVVNLGDIIDRDLISYEHVLKILKKLESPLFHVLGNHDFSVNKKDKKKITRILGMKKRYYSLKIENYRFIFLDGNDISFYSNSRLNYKRWKAAKILASLKKNNSPNATIWNGGIGTMQQLWLNKTLRSSKKKSEKVIIFCHFPLVPSGSYYNLWNNDKIKRIIKKYNSIVAYISGHDHEGAYNFINGLHYYTVKGMIETSNTNAFAIVNVYTDSFKIKGYGREEDRVLNYKLPEIK